MPCRLCSRNDEPPLLALLRGDGNEAAEELEWWRRGRLTRFGLVFAAFDSGASS